MRLPTLTLATLLLAAAGAQAAPAPVRPPVTRTVHEQLGMTRQTAVGDRLVAWTRCTGPNGPTEVWVAPRARGRAWRVPRLRARGACEPITLVGTTGRRVVALITGADGLRTLASVDARTGVRTAVDADTAGEDGVRVTAADLNGVRLVWLRESGAGTARISEAILTDTRDLTRRRTLYTRSMAYGAVRPVAVWAAPNGRAVVRELLTGALYGYGERDERAMLVGGARPQQIVNLNGGTRMAAGDVSARWFVYSLARDGDPRTRVVAYEIATGRRRVIRLARLVPAGISAVPPAVPAPSVSGNLVAWRERLRIPGGYRDRVISLDLAARRARTLFALRDTRGQRLFVSQPSVRDGRVTLAEVQLSTAYGAPGGFLGETPVGARSRILLVRLR